jgi:hypothetical protein
MRERPVRPAPDAVEWTRSRRRNSTVLGTCCDGAGRISISRMPLNCAAKQLARLAIAAKVDARVAPQDRDANQPWTSSISRGSFRTKVVVRSDTL